MCRACNYDTEGAQRYLGAATIADLAGSLRIFALHSQELRYRESSGRTRESKTNSFLAEALISAVRQYFPSMSKIRSGLWCSLG